jgi:hypothetical protein
MGGRDGRAGKAMVDVLCSLVVAGEIHALAPMADLNLPKSDFPG